MTEHLDPINPPTEEHLRTLQEDEIIDLIRETVQHLNALGDRLESYAERRLRLKAKSAWTGDDETE